MLWLISSAAAACSLATLTPLQSFQGGQQDAKVNRNTAFKITDFIHVDTLESDSPDLLNSGFEAAAAATLELIKGNRNKLWSKQLTRSAKKGNRLTLWRMSKLCIRGSASIHACSSMLQVCIAVSCTTFWTGLDGNSLRPAKLRRAAETDDNHGGYLFKGTFPLIWLYIWEIKICWLKWL